MKNKYFVFFVLFFIPFFAKAEILISEISWMGNESSANAEWIELENTGGSSVNMSGWTLKSEDGSPSINLSGSISAGAYSLLERTSDSTVPGVSALVTYSGALSNSGEHLVLRDGNGNVIQNLNFSSGWPAGNNTTKETMQWNGSIWITSDSTPGSQNASFDSGSVGDQGTDTGDDEEADDDSDNDSDNGSSSSSNDNSKIKYDKELVEIKTQDSSVPAGTPVKFSLKTRDFNGANIYSGDFLWNMGDGTERYFSKNEKFEHTYDHEGSYVVYLRYYSTYFEGMEPDAVDKITVTINNTSVAISKIHLDGSVEIKNSSSQEVDLSNWVLKDILGKYFTIPNGTFIQANKSLVLNSKRLRLNTSKITLLTPSGSFASYKDNFPATSSIASVVKSSSSKATTSVKATESSTQTSLDEETSTNLNEKLDSKKDKVKQKQSSVWIIVFVVMILGICVAVFLIYRNQEEEIKEEDDFELIE